MTSYYDVFEVAPGDEPSGVSEGDSEWNPSEMDGWQVPGHERDWSMSSWATWRGWDGGRGGNWSWDDRSMGGESQQAWSDWSGRAGRARVPDSEQGQGSERSMDGERQHGGGRVHENWSRGDRAGASDPGQEHVPGRREDVGERQENWAWESGSAWDYGDRDRRAGGHRPAPDQRQVHEPDQRQVHEPDQGQGHGHGGGASVYTPVAGFDRQGNPPSGEVSSAGDVPDPRGPGDEPKSQGSGRGKISSSYPPIFRAKPGESYRDWRRSLEFWLGGEGHQIPEEYIGPRIMVQLRDRAAQLVKHLNNSDVNRPGGMQKIFDILERSPLVKQLDKHRVDQQRKRLMALSRYAGESLESYITRGSIYRTQLLGLDSTLEMGERFYVGHLMDHARLSRRDKVLIRARAGDETEENVTNAMVELAAELEGEQGYPIGASEPNTAGANGEEWLVQRAPGGGQPLRRGGGQAALVAELTNENDDEDPPDTEDLGEDSIEEDPEFKEVEREAYALHYKAKQRMAEVKKLRQYYRKGDQVDERKRALAEKIKNTACHNCGEVGHWSRECPNPKAQPVLMATTSRTSGRRSKGRASGSTGRLSSLPEEAGQDHEWDLLLSLCTDGGEEKNTPAVRAYMTLPCGVGPLGGMAEHEVLWCVKELATAVILDIGCLKSVAGTTWMNQLLHTWQRKGWWFKVFKEKEVFRFGSGDTLTSQYGVQFQATFAGKEVILGFSVVKGECPPLLSRHACTQLGVQFDCEHHVLNSRKLGVKNYGLRQTSSGHYLMDIAEFGDESTWGHSGRLSPGCGPRGLPVGAGELCVDGGDFWLRADGRNHPSRILRGT